MKRYQCIYEAGEKNEGGGFEVGGAFLKPYPGDTRMSNTTYAIEFWAATEGRTLPLWVEHEKPKACEPVEFFAEEFIRSLAKASVLVRVMFAGSTEPTELAVVFIDRQVRGIGLASDWVKRASGFCVCVPGEKPTSEIIW